MGDAIEGLVSALENLETIGGKARGVAEEVAGPINARMCEVEGAAREARQYILQAIRQIIHECS